jgi:transcriptional regulator with XRE-family HTH domain
MDLSTDKRRGPRPDDHRSRIGVNLRHLAGLHDISQRELADHLELSAQGVWNILHERSEPRMRTAERIASAFAIPLDALFTDTGSCVRSAAAAFERAPVRAIRLGAEVGTSSNGRVDH